MTVASRFALIGTLTLGLLGCSTSGYQVGQMVPQILGGAPNTIPPPRGTSEYEAWLKKPGPSQDAASVHRP